MSIRKLIADQEDYELVKDLFDACRASKITIFDEKGRVEYQWERNAKNAGLKK